MSYSLLFSIVFSNVCRYSTRMEILLYMVLFCTLQSVTNSFSHIQFSCFCGTLIFVVWKRNNIISCLLIRFTHQVEVLLLIVFNLQLPPNNPVMSFARIAPLNAWRLCFWCRLFFILLQKFWFQLMSICFNLGQCVSTYNSRQKSWHTLQYLSGNLSICFLYPSAMLCIAMKVSLLVYNIVGVGGGCLF